MSSRERKPLKHLQIPRTLGIGEGGKTLPQLYHYFQQVDEYIDELKSGGGQAGNDGKSAYDIAVDNGFEGSEQDWLDSLKGKDGQDGKDGTDGTNGTDGNDGKDGKDGKDAEPQFTQEQVDALLALIEEGDD